MVVCRCFGQARFAQEDEEVGEMPKDGASGAVKAGAAFVFMKYLQKDRIGSRVPECLCTGASSVMHITIK